MRRWLDAIPPDVYRVRPVLAIGWVSSRLVSGDLEGVEARLAEAEQRLARPDDGMVVVDEEAFRRIPAAIAMYRTALARGSGDVDAHDHPCPAACSRSSGEDEHLARGGGRGLPRARLLDARGPRGRAPVLDRRGRRASSGRGTSPTWSVGRSPSRTSGSRRAASATRCGTTNGDWPWRRGRAGPPLRGVGGHARRHERAAARAERSRRGDAAPRRRAASWASRRAWRRTRTAGASRWRACARRTGTSTLPTTCSTMPSGCTRATSSRRCGRSRP